jgi:ribosomal protein L11 methyltransferase
MGEIAMAWLADQGFESFEEQAGGFVGVIPTEQFDRADVAKLIDTLPGVELEAEEEMPDINWNQAWEAAYDPIEVDDFCQVIASFHPEKSGFAYTLHITPKMSFGTGHHPTTRLMMRQMRHLPVAGTKVLDMGCGTGILAILARMMKAESALGIDIDRWSHENAQENAELNQIDGISWLQGDATAIPDQSYDLILANINRNVLLADIPTYARHLSPGGHLVLSGFVEEDLPLILAATEAQHLHSFPHLQEGEWLSVTVKHD